MTLDRRSFLARSAALLAAAPLSRRFGVLPDDNAPLPHIGIQLYTVRDRMKTSVPDTLKAIAAIGYREVEMAGYFGHSPAELRTMLRDLGLAVPSTHVGPDDFQKSVDDAAELGCDYIVLPWIDESARGSLGAWQKNADMLNTFAHMARQAGLRFGYHNHDFEFVKTDGRIPLDVLFERTDPKVVDFELDLYWARHGGGDIAKYLASGRVTMVHAKDWGAPPALAMSDVGSGTADWATLLHEARQGGATHWFVEHDEPKDSLASARASYDYLASLNLPLR